MGCFIMDALSRSQCWNLPKNEINAHNRYWRNLVKTQDQNFLIQCLKGKQINIDKYIKQNSADPMDLYKLYVICSIL